MKTLDIDFIQTVINDLVTIELELEIVGSSKESLKLRETINMLEDRIRALEMCEIMCEEE